MNRLRCPALEDLSAFVRGDLVAVQVDDIAEHLNECEACVRQLATLSVDDPFAAGIRQAARFERSTLAVSAELQQRLVRLPAFVATLSHSVDQTPAPGFPHLSGTQLERSATSKPSNDDFRGWLSPPETDDELGRLGAYRVLKLLGEGGMGVVLLAEEVALRREVALKLIRPRYASDAEVAARFQREARATASVQSEHVISIFAVGEAGTPQGRVPFMAMELLNGESIEQRLQRGPMSIDEVFEISLQVLTGLAAVHAKGLVHRDIKPGNLWIEEVPSETEPQGASRAGLFGSRNRQISDSVAADPKSDDFGYGAIGPGRAEPEKPAASVLPLTRDVTIPTHRSVRAKLLDFGLAHVGDASTVLTQLGTLVGTPAYMSPEQASGHEVDARSDLFSFGAVLYEMLTSQPPFRGAHTMAVLMALARDTPPEPRAINAAVPERLSQLVMRLLQKDASRRPASALEVLNELRAVHREFVAASKPPSASCAGSFGSRNRQISESVAADPKSDDIGYGAIGPERIQPKGTNEPAASALPLTNRNDKWRRLVMAVTALGLLVGAAAVLIRVTTPKGTLVIETEDDSVEVRVTRNGATIFDRTKDRKLQLELGEYGIELVNKVNGLKISAEKVTITREGQPPIRVWREAPKEIAAQAAPVRPQTQNTTGRKSVAPIDGQEVRRPDTAAVSPELFERPQVLRGSGRGKWRVQDGELFCAEHSGGNEEDWLFFGLLDWKDYDFSIEARTEPTNEGHGPGVFFRSRSSRHATLTVCNVFRCERDNFEEIEGDEWRAPWNNSHMPVHVGRERRDWSKQWRPIRVSVRGKSAKVFVDDEQILAYDKLVFDSGYVGVRSHRTFASRFRRPKVTLPDGRVLLDNWPAIPQAIQSVDTAAARRFVDWAIARSGGVVAARKVLKSGADLPDDSMLHLVRFDADPAEVRPLNDEDLDAFRDFPGTENYIAFRFPDITTAGVIKLGSYLRGKPIQCFQLIDSPIGLSWLREPGGLREIGNATFQNIAAKNDELRHIKNLPYLDTLNLRFNKEITDAAVEHLLVLKQLKHLHLEGTSISPAGLARLKAAFSATEITHDQK